MNSPIIKVDDVKEKLVQGHSNAELLFKLYVLQELKTIGARMYYVDRKLDELKNLVIQK